MLKKLLKYDFNAIFKYWWIGALTTFILSFVGAGCGSILETEKDLPESVSIFATIGLVLIVLSFFAFIIMNALLVYIRFYKHLFSDEGYLTFTLPVKRNQILASKLLSGGLATFFTAIITAINSAIIFLITFKKDFFYQGWKKDFDISVNRLIANHGIFNLVIESLEIVLIFILSIILITLFTYLCITIGAIISKKAKLASVIGIYYGASTLMIFFMYIFYFFGIDALNGWITSLPENQEYAVLPVLLLLILLTLLMLCLVIYTLIDWLIDRKLNLN